MTLIAIEWDDDAGRDGRGAVRLLDQTLLPGTTTVPGDPDHRRARRRDRRAGRAGRPGPRCRGGAGGGARHGRGRPRGLARRTGPGGGRPGPARPPDRGQPRLGRRPGAPADGCRAAMPCSSPPAGSPPRTRPPTASCPGSAPTGCSPGSTGPGCGCSPTATPDRSRPRAWGTALGVIRELHARDRLELVYADETRPLLQGSRLTAFELAADGIPHRVQADGAAASTILRGLVDLAVVGADRIAANGDAANKIGTLGVALACRDAGIPFMVAAPWSTVDLSMADGVAHRDRGATGRGGHGARGGAPGARGVAGASTRRSTSRRRAWSMPSRPSVEWPSRARHRSAGPRAEGADAARRALGVAGPYRHKSIASSATNEDMIFI